MCISLKMALIVGVAVLAVGGITVGIVFATMGSKCVGHAAPGNVQFEERDSKVYLLWTHPETLGECVADYRVILTVDGVAREPSQIKGDEVEVEDYEVCSKLKATVSTLDDNGDESEVVTSDEYEVGVGDITKVGVGNLKEKVEGDSRTISWERPGGVAKCDVKYKVTLNEEALGSSISDLSVKISEDKLRYCTNNIVVTPQMQGKDGKVESLSVEKEVGDFTNAIVGQITPEENEDSWVISWEAPTNYENCNLIYKVTLDDVEVGEAHVGVQIEIPYGEAQICSHHQLMVLPILKLGEGENEEEIEGEAKGIPIKRNVGDVTNIEVGELTTAANEDSWRITWEKPTSFESCNVIYKVTFKDEVLEEAYDGVTIDIPYGDAATCIDYKVDVTPIIETSEGKEKEVMVRKKIGDVTNENVGELTTEAKENSWTISWQRPSGFESCNIVYKVLLDSKEITTDHREITIDIEYDEAKTCTDYKVIVSPIIEGSEGKSEERTVRRDIGDVSNIQVEEFTTAANEDSWKITWEKPTSFESCNVIYKVTFKDEVLQEAYDGVTIDIPYGDAATCTDYKVVVTPIIESSEGKEKEVTVRRNIGDVTNVNVGTLTTEAKEDSWTITWQKPSGFESCNIVYKVLLDSKEITADHGGITIDIPYDEAKTCTDYKVIVSPIIEGSDGKTEEETVRRNIGDTTNIQVEEITTAANEDSWKITWEKPTSFESCNVIYKVTFKDEVIQEAYDGVTIDIPYGDAATCTDYKVAVTPTIESSEGAEKDVIVRRNIGDLTNVNVGTLTAEAKENSWTINWQTPSGFESCNIVYKVLLDSKEITADHGGITIDIEYDDAKTCTDYKVIVSPIIEGSEGKTEEKTVRRDIGDITNIQVEELTTAANEDSWKITWEKPTSFESCNVIYKVTFNGAVIKEAHDEVSIDILYEDAVICTDYEVLVTPIIETKEGAPKQVMVRRNIGDLANVNVGTLTTEAKENSWTISWQKPSGFDTCTIVYKILFDDEEIVAPREELTIDIQYNEALICTNYKVAVIPIIETGEGAKAEATIRRDVGDVTNSNVGEVTATEIANGWTISWSTPSGYDDCEITYRVLLNNEELSSEPQDQTNVEIGDGDSLPCAENDVTVTAIIESKPGGPKNAEFTGNPAVIGPVQNGKISGPTAGQVMVTWEKPAGLEQCEFSYEFKLYKGDDTVPIAEGTPTTNSWEGSVDNIENCNDLKASVKAVHPSKAGELTEDFECVNNKRKLE